jgi:hypothetical protein
MSSTKKKEDRRIVESETLRKRRMKSRGETATMLVRPMAIANVSDERLQHKACCDLITLIQENRSG